MAFAEFATLADVCTLSPLAAPSAFCTVATFTVAKELLGLTLSLAKHHPGAVLYILCDTKTNQRFQEEWSLLPLTLVWVVELDRYSGKSRVQMETERTWSEFQMSKARVLDIALASHADVLFLDADILVTAPFVVCPKRRLGVSPGYIADANAAQVGYFNGGMLWTSSKTIPDLWRHFTARSRYYDQASIEDLVRVNGADNTFIWTEEVNVQCWRCIVGRRSGQDTINLITPDPLKRNVLMHGRPIVCFHTHFGAREFHVINEHFKRKMALAGMTDELAIVREMETYHTLSDVSVRASSS